MAKYDPLKHYLSTQRGPSAQMDFDEIADLVGGLPASAFNHAAWWANDSNTHVQARAWLDAGWLNTEVDLPNRRVTFAIDESEIQWDELLQPQNRRDWDEDSFFAELERVAPIAIPSAKALVAWVNDNERIKPSYGTGRIKGSMIAWAFIDGDETEWLPLFALWTNGTMNGTWRYRGKHNDAPWWPRYVSEIARISGVPQSLTRSHAFSLAGLSDEAIGDLKSAASVLIDEARTAIASGEPSASAS